jgi:hypothetical protein
MPYRAWDPFGSRDRIASLWSSAGMPSVSSGAAAGYRALFTTFRRLVVGRSLTVELEGRQLTLAVTEMDSELDLLGLTVGQFGDVTMAARDICWGDHRCQHAAAVLRNVHFRPSSQSLVAAPVELELELPSDVVEALVRRARSGITADVDADGVARLRMTHHAALGHLEVDVGVLGAVLWLKPRTVVLRRRRWTLPASVPAYPIVLPNLPYGLLITSITPQSGSLLVSGVLPEWRTELPRRRWEDIVDQLSSASGVLNLARSTWRT